MQLNPLLRRLFPTYRDSCFTTNSIHGASIAKYPRLPGRRSANGIFRTGGKKMTPRDIVLASVRNNLPQPTVPLPENIETDQKGTTSGLGYKQHLTSFPKVESHLSEPILAYF